MTPVVSVPVLSRTTARMRAADSSAWALLTPMPSSAPRPTAVSSAVGVARPSAHGQATTSTATAALQAAAAGRPGAQPEPEGGHGAGDHARHEHRGDPVRQPLRAGLGAQRLADQAGDLRQQRAGADPDGAHHQPPAHVHGGPGHLVTGSHLGRHRLAGDAARRRPRRSPPPPPRRWRSSPPAGRRTGPPPRARPPAPAARFRPAAPRPSWRPSTARRRQCRPGTDPGACLQIPPGQHRGGDARGGLQVQGLPAGLRRR